jgi:hypothetical protein
MNIIVKTIERVVRPWIREEVQRQLTHIGADDEPLSPQASASIAASLEDVRQGRAHGPFRSSEELIARLHGRRN